MRRRLFIPEVVQTSATDCGPAALKALFAGFGIYLSYGRLREACQTGVDGTSIDTLETLANTLGLEAEQRMMPLDLLLLESSACVPAIVVTRLPDGSPHFVVLWRVHRSFVQVMDPAAGRIWMHKRRFLDLVHQHEHSVPVSDWQEWTRTSSFTSGLEQRLRALDLASRPWGEPATADAAVRLARHLVDEGLLRNAEINEVVELCVANPEQVPPEFWTARPADSDVSQVRVRGAVILAVTGRREDFSMPCVGADIAAIRAERSPRLGLALWAAVRDGGLAVPLVLAGAVVAAAVGVVIEAVLFRSLFELTHHLTLSGQRMAGLSMVVVFLCGLLALEWPAAVGTLQLGRQLEVRLRIVWMKSIPRLGDRYFQSRLVTDMASRAHALFQLRELPEVAGHLLRLGAALFVTVAAMFWLYPGTLPFAAASAVGAVAVPLAFQRWQIERDLRVRETSAGLSRFYLDALLGLRPIHAHGAVRTMLAVQRPQLRRWAEAGLGLQTLLVRAEAVQTLLQLTPIVWLVRAEAVRTQTPASLLLLIYWSLSLPAIGRQFASFVWALPSLRNTVLRFLEPLDSTSTRAMPAAPVPEVRDGAAVDIRELTVMAAGQPILQNVNVHIAPGEHIAVVGRSGAGKSSLAGVLLGFYKPAAGSVSVDGAPLDEGRVMALRQRTAWIDPQVHLFRATLFDNLAYGNTNDAGARVGVAVTSAQLLELLKHLPAGLQTELGEGGTNVSGGEGQRVRIGRALARSCVRLAILDEPARGLDRRQRHQFLAQARRHFKGATLLAITHDVGDSIDFDHVLVIEQGRIVEQGVPGKLFATRGSRYRALLEEENAVGHLWSDPRWRRCRMADGELIEAAQDRVWTTA